MSDSIFLGGGGPDHKAPQTLLLQRARSPRAGGGRHRHGQDRHAPDHGRAVLRRRRPRLLFRREGRSFRHLRRRRSRRQGVREAAGRAADIGMPAIQFGAAPCVFWDIYGVKGHPIRATTSEMGPQLLARLLQLNETQEGVLTIAFQYADDNGLLLLDFKDLRALLTHISTISADIQKTYGNVSAASIGAVQRALLMLEREGAPQFFGEPALQLTDLMKTAPDGRGYINVLDATTLINSPRLYSTFLLWLLAELFEQLPEIGDPDKPKLVFFFDEAHLLFNDAPKALTDKIEQVVRLIRSKGVGVYFVTQNPRDLPETVLAQLGCRIQHALRAYTPTERKGVKAAAQKLPPQPRHRHRSRHHRTWHRGGAGLDARPQGRAHRGRAHARPPAILAPRPGHRRRTRSRPGRQSLRGQVRRHDRPRVRLRTPQRPRSRRRESGSRSRRSRKLKLPRSKRPKPPPPRSASRRSAIRPIRRTARKLRPGLRPKPPPPAPRPASPPARPRSKRPPTPPCAPPPANSPSSSSAASSAAGNGKRPKGQTMCGKFTQLVRWEHEAEFAGQLPVMPDDAPVVFATPMRTAKLIRLGEDGRRELVRMRWGFSKPSATRPQPDHMHARSETVDSKPRFCDAFGERRGILMVETFNEGEEQPGGRTQAVGVPPEGRKPIAIAVIWEEFQGEAGAELTFLQLTVPANPLVSKITDRMPAILPAGALARLARRDRRSLQGHQGAARRPSTTAATGR